MASTSKCKKSKKVKQEERNWSELPSDVTANILNRIGVFDILENAQKVCTSWRKTCKDPAMWRVIYMDNKFLNPKKRPSLREMCKQAVDRSQGQLVEISIMDFANDRLLQYIADRSSQLKRLSFTCCYGNIYNSWTECLQKFPLLEELSLCSTNISKEAIQTAGRCCPNLKILKVNQQANRFLDRHTDAMSLRTHNEIAIAIGENLGELRHLELIGNSMRNIGLQKILDGCSLLESLDLRQCLYIDLKGDLGKRCCQQINCLKLPNDSLEGCPYIKEVTRYDSDEENFWDNCYD